MKYSWMGLLLVGSLLVLSWTRANNAFAEGMTGYYYQRATRNGPVVTGPYDYKVIDRKIDFAVSTWDWKPFGMKDHFSACWRGWIYIERGGPYLFATFSDDGSFLYIDDTKVMDNNKGGLEPSWATGKIDLAGGYHKVEIVYYNWKGSSGMGLYWDTGQGARLVPGEILFPEDFIARGDNGGRNE